MLMEGRMRRVQELGLPSELERARQEGRRLGERPTSEMRVLPKHREIECHTANGIDVLCPGWHTVDCCATTQPPLSLARMAKR